MDGGRTSGPQHPRAHLEAHLGAYPRPQIVIVGGGLAGAATALHLLRDHDPAADITLVEPGQTLGAGLAYGTAEPTHRVNVAASRMSLFDEAPDDFDAWLHAGGHPGRDPASALPDGRLYPQRAMFGHYVHAALQAAAAAARHARLTHRRARAVGAAPDGAGFLLRLEDGQALHADTLVLAVSHTAPDLPAFLAPLAAAKDRRLVANPWRPDALDAVPPEHAVLIVGTGLTGCDVVASLIARGHAGPIVAVSRRGLLPRPRTSVPVSAFGRFDDPPARTALALLQSVRAAMREAAALGRPWEDVIDALRQQARAVWGALPVAERRSLLRHCRPFWDAHRFQSAPQIDAAILAARAAGQLEVLAATPLDAAPLGKLLRVTLHPRGTPADQRIVRDVAAIVNCTGPGHRSVVERHPVLRALHEAGALAADPLALGIAVDAESRVLRPDGSAWPNLFVAGPLARGTHGELMGLPQMSRQPREVAASIGRPEALPLDTAGA